jgi:hypothetical protein
VWQLLRARGPERRHPLAVRQVQANLSDFLLLRSRQPCSVLEGPPRAAVRAARREPTTALQTTSTPTAVPIPAPTVVPVPSPAAVPVLAPTAFQMALPKDRVRTILRAHREIGTDYSGDWWQTYEPVGLWGTMEPRQRAARAVSLLLFFLKVVFAITSSAKLTLVVRGFRELPRHQAYTTGVQPWVLDCGRRLAEGLGRRRLPKFRRQGEVGERGVRLLVPPPAPLVGRLEGTTNKMMAAGGGLIPDQGSSRGSGPSKFKGVASISGTRSTAV